jgi:hypothetical protein
MPLSKIKTNSISNPVALTTPVIDGVGYTPFNLRNRFINGNFDFWQRSTSATLTGSSYPAPDRWVWIYDGTSSSTNTVSRQTFALGQTDVPGNPKYFMQYTYGVTSTPNNYFRQNIESVLTLAGKTCTVSFWARCTSGTVSCSYQNQQEFGSGGSPSSGVYGIGSASFTLTTTWQKFVITHTLPSITGKTVGTTHDGSMNPSFYFPTNAGNTVQFAQMQFEEGSVATPFEQRPLALELQLCQRYFEYGFTRSLTTVNFSGSYNPDHNWFTQFKVEKRGTPTVTRSNITDTQITFNGITPTVYGFTSEWDGTTNGQNSSQFNYLANSEL